jgi:hypothetical protein
MGLEKEEKIIGKREKTELVKEIFNRFKALNNPEYFVSSTKYSKEYQKQPEMSAWEFGNVLTEVGYLVAKNVLDQVLWLMRPSGSMDDFEKNGIIDVFSDVQDLIKETQGNE